MTTMLPVDVKCAICGTTSTHMVVASTSTFGAPDLDTRPPPLQRSTIADGIQRCPECGYCAPELSHSSVGREAVQRSDYANQLADPAFSELTNSYLCWARLCEGKADHSSAGWGALQAAWVCDDDDRTERSRDCRHRAALSFQRAWELGDSFASDAASEHCIVIDVLRRAGRFAEARQVLDASAKLQLDDLFVRILSLERLLIQAEDATCHTVDEALNPSG
jgi:hypothetical protein